MNELTKSFCPYGSLMACRFIKQDRSRGGVILPDLGADDIPASVGEVQKAEVIAVGPEVVYYKPGDVVLIRQGSFLAHNGQKFVMVPEEETFGCENRDLERPEGNDTLIKREAEKKLRAMVFEETSQIIAGMVSSGMLAAGKGKR